VRVQLRRGARADDGGAIAIMVALLATLLIVLAAFTTDFGLAYAQRQALATGADSAALSIVREAQLQVTKNPALTCAQLVTSNSASANVTALRQVNANSPYGAVLVAGDVTTTLSCVGPSAGVLQAAVTVAKPVQTVFGGLVGVSTININRQSAAALGAVNGVSGFLPIAVCTNQAQAIVANAIADVPSRSTTYRHELVSLAKVWKPGNDCGAGGSGNWGFLDCQGNSANSIADGIQNGCPDTITLNGTTTPPSFTASGTPGNKLNSGQVDNALATIMDKVRVIPVYSTVTGNGNNATYTIVGFLSAKICGTKANNKTNTGSCYLGGVEPLSGVDVSLVQDSLQIQYVAYTPVSSISTLCGLGTVTCQFNSTTTQLVR
jgi:Flp pilus assembly protein TadG